MNKRSDVERIATLLKLTGEEDKLCLKIQDEIKKKDRKIKVLITKNMILQRQLDNSETTTTVIQRNMDGELKKEREELRNELMKLKLVNMGLQKEIAMYRNEKFNNRIVKESVV